MRRKSFLVNFKVREGDKGLKNNPFHFIFFDTETYQTEEAKKIGQKEYRTVINKLNMGWACYWNREEDTTEWIYFEEIADFHKFITKVIKKTKKKTLWLVAHNIVFDNIITDIWSFFEKRNFETDFIHSKGMVYIQKLAQRTTSLIKKGKNAGKEKTTTQKVVMLVNNGNIFPAKLETIGETIGLGKMHVDFKEDSPEYIKVYCKRDVEILLEFWKQWIDFIDTNELGKVKYTISSQSMEAFRKRFCNDYIVLDDDIDNLDFERKAYYGGRTEIFYKGQVRKPVYYFDVNSMYPYVMKEFRYPTEYKFSKDKPAIDDVMRLVNKGWLIVAEVYLDTKNNCYPVKQDNTLLFPTGKFKTYLCTPEVIEAYNNGDIVKFGHVSYYHGANIFSDYVTFFYEERLKKKREGNKQEKMYKLFLNSLYGKFGQKMDSWQGTTEDEIKAIIPDFNLTEWIMDNFKLPHILFNGIDITPKIRYIGGQLQSSGEEEESNISFPAIAGHVTSYARLILWKVIRWCKEHKVKYYYCDTDSIFTSAPIDPEMVDNDILGKLKLEKLYENGVEFINLKNYCALTKEGYKVVENEIGDKITLDGETFLKESKVIKGSSWKMKGVSNNAVMLDEDTVIQQEWGGLPKQEYYRHFGRKPGEFWVIYKEKHNIGTINKGNLTGDGTIQPFEMEEVI